MRRIFNGEVWTKTSAWSADGTTIAWAYDACADIGSDGPCDRINVANADGTERVDYFFSGASWSPSWYPSERKIVFARGVDGIEGSVDLYVASLDDAYKVTGLTQFTFSPEAIETTPDVSEIAISSDRDGDSDIWRMGADGSNPTKLTRNTIDDANPDWQPR